MNQNSPVIADLPSLPLPNNVITGLTPTNIPTNIPSPYGLFPTYYSPMNMYSMQMLHANRIMSTWNQPFPFFPFNQRPPGL